MKKAMIGYQVYSAREEASKDLLGVLKALSDMGYDGVEMAGYYGHSAQEVKKMLDETELKAISSHVAIPDTLPGLYEAVGYAREIGCEYMAVPFLDEAHRPGSAGFAKTIRAICQYGRLCQEADMQLLYHNHDFEFISLSGQYGLDFLYDAIDEDLLKTELDTCWVKYAGEDPAAYIRKYADRCPIVHLKDYVGQKGEKQPYALINADGSDDGKNEAAAFEFRPVGHGCQNVPSLIEAGIESGAKWFIVEQDQWYDRPALTAAKMSIDYLKSIGM